MKHARMLLAALLAGLWLASGAQAQFFESQPVEIEGGALVAAPTWDRKNTAGNQFILRGDGAELADLAARYGLEILQRLGDDAEASGAALVRGPETLAPEQMSALLDGDAEVLGFEPVVLATIPEATLEQSTTPILEQSTTPILEAVRSSGVDGDEALAAFFAGPLWNGYVNQPAVELLRIRQAHAGGSGASGFGSGIVAVIDTGIDPDHPLLAGALVDGYDFILDQPGLPSELRNLDETTAAVVEQSTTPILEQSTTPILEGQGDLYFLDQTSTALLEEAAGAAVEELDLPPTFGHGTLVAGVVRLVAPGARIMPLRAFDANGTASIFDIVRAIRFAVDHGANVINMSFSVDAYSPELAKAVNYAHRNGVVCVAAAGNHGRRITSYPAVLGNAVGVASTGYDDLLSGFSNYGSDIAALAAPGEGIITTYPGGAMAAVWGTSFSTPFVAGTVALLHDTTGNGTLKSPAGFYQALYSLSKGSAFLPHLAAELGTGRLDVAGAVENRMHVTP